LGVFGLYTVQYGTFNNGTWKSNGNLIGSTSNTIRVENGVKK